MQEDPRSRNETFNLESIKAHLNEYAGTLWTALLAVDEGELNRAVALIEKCREHGMRLWVAGNGGSAAIADHLLCDWVKGTHIHLQPQLNVHSLVANTALVTAISNDFSYEVVFSQQLAMQARPGDVLLVISSSGNSPNIVTALHQAKAQNMRTIAFTGFSGGHAAKLADISVHVPTHNYGVVEDAHQALMHNIAQYLYGRFTKACARHG